LGQEIDDEVVLAAVEKATAADFVEEYGLDSNVGTDGSLFSGGQKQRLSIARAMLRNASVMLLDESTSALDNFHEFEVMNAFRALTPEVTIISIAHRLSSLNCSDFIVVIN
jgi:ABC-type multidrug transport system fused ATPase/permease subunit